MTKYRVRRLHKTKAEATRAAKATLAELSRGRVAYACSAPGDASMFAGALLNVIEHDPDVDGQYRVKTVTHTLNGSGYLMSLTAESTNDDGGSPLTASGKDSSTAFEGDSKSPADSVMTPDGDQEAPGP